MYCRLAAWREEEFRAKTAKKIRRDFPACGGKSGDSGTQLYTTTQPRVMQG
jgi:hypothetical protein